MNDSFRVIAIIAAFNEGDMISPVIKHLVENGIEVYLIDNHSTDDTVQQANRWLGQGLLHIETFPAKSDLQSHGSFDWTAILRRKEELANILQADWFIHHDADEIRESPWPNVNLREAIWWVDKLGYNCIDFRVLNFPPVDDGFRSGDDPRSYFNLYEEAEEIDKVQRKAWKATKTPKSLVTSAGHEVRFKDRRVFPIQFLLLHYPIRGQEHGIKKIFRERKPRFLQTERSQGWHVQYDRILDESHSFLKDPRSLILFDLDKARLELSLPGELLRNFANMQGERDELREHASNLEIDRDEIRQHAANLEQARESLKQHVTNLETDRAELRQYAANLEQARESQKQHVTNLETDRAELRHHAANLEREREGLKQNVTNLETDRADLRQQLTNLERERDGLNRHVVDLEMERQKSILLVATLQDELSSISSRAESLEQSRQQLEERKSGLERELAEIQNSFVWRSTSLLRRLFNAPGKAGKTHEHQPSPQESQAILSHLDVPAESQTTVVETCLIRGWTCSPNGIESVKVLVDGNLVQQFSPDLERPDVALVHPEIPGSGRSGFDLTVQIGVLSQGFHELQLVIRDRAGNECQHHRSLQVFASPYHRVLLEKQLRGDKREALLQSVVTTGRSPHFELWLDGRSGDDLSQTLRSIAAQTYPTWTCHIVGDAGGGMPSCVEGSPVEGVQWHSSFASVSVNDGGSGDFLAFLLPGERLLPDALLHLASRLAEESASLAYADHDLVESTGTHTDPEHAPDWSPEHLYGRNYIGGVFFVRRNEIQRHGLDTEGVDWRYDLLLHITESAERIIHIPQVLWSSPPFVMNSAALAEAELRAVEEALKRRGTDAEVIALPDMPIRRVRRRLAATPMVSIIIPTTGRLDLVRPLVDSLLANTAYPNYEFLFIDNGRGKHSDGIEFLRSHGMGVIERDEPFNWARLNNAGARACDGELLLFLNDDIEVIESGWLEELVAQVLVPDVGTLGALLLYPDGRIQHAGVFHVDHGGGSRHYLQFLDLKRVAYQPLDRVVREVTASTGACLMVRREVFEEVGGFDEGFRVAFNDIDFCMRLSERGYRNLWTPYSRLVHHESLSRKGTNITEDEQRVWNRWGGRLLAGDAYHNPNLAKDRGDCTIDTSVLNPRPTAKQGPGEGWGVNLIGYIRAEMGVGEAARGLARAMERTGIPFVIIDYEYGNPANKGDLSWSHRIVERPVHGVNILNVNADLTPEACERLGAKVFEGRYTIGYWVWELPEFPDRWLSSFECVNEVWVPTEFVRKAIAPKSSAPVTRIPHPVEKGPGPYFERPFFDLPSKCFLFLSMYDTHSVMNRKNPEGVIAAFRDAFSPTDRNAGLVVKINNFDAKEGEKLRTLIGDHSNIYLIDRSLSRYEVDSLLACCDCFVSLHRSEGFGLPIAEAMALGKPVIATNWSGNVDFMDETCAACVDFQIRQLGCNYGPYDAHQHWAEPSLESAARWMRTLHAEPATARRIGAAGQRRIRESFSDRSVGGLIRARLVQIALAHSHLGLMQNSNSPTLRTGRETSCT